MNRQHGLVIALLLATAACGGGSPTAPTPVITTPPPAVTVTSITLTGSNGTTVQIGESTTLILTAYYSDGTSAVVPDTCPPDSDSIASLDAACTVTGVGAGTAIFDATHNGLSASVTITVTLPLASLTASASATTVVVGQTVVLSATAHYSDGSSAPFTAEWTSSDVSIATVESGTVTGVAAGTVTMTVAHGGQTASIVITVTPPVTLTGLTAEISASGIEVGESSTIVTATGHFSDGSSSSIQASWVSSDPSIATVDAAGTVTGVGAGTVTLTASYGGQTASIAITITPPITVTSLTVGGTASRVPVNHTTADSVTGHYSDGTSGPVEASWVSSNPSVVVVGDTFWISSNSAYVTSFTGVAEGTATLTASYGGQSVTFVLLVLGLTSITAEITNSGIEVGSSTSVRATGHYSDGTSLSVKASWVSSNPSVTAVGDTYWSSSNSYYWTKVTAVAPGTATLTASYGGQSFSIVVTWVVLTSITAEIASSELSIGSWTSVLATGHYSDGSAGTVKASWVSSNPSVAAVGTTYWDPTELEWWTEVTAVAPGTVTLTGSYQGLSASTTITVKPLEVWAWATDLLKGGWVENAEVRTGSASTGTTGPNGKSIAGITEYGRLPIVIEANGFHKSESQLDVSNQSNTYAYRRLLTTDTSTFDLNFYDHVFRNKGTRGTRRWATMPTVEIWTKEMKCLETSGEDDKYCDKFEATATAAPSTLETYFRSVVNTDVPSLTGDVLSGVSVTTKNHATGTVLTRAACAEPNKIVVTYINPDTSNFSGGYSYAGVCRYTSGEIRSSYIHMAWISMGTAVHEMAHTLGWRHPDGYDSIPRPSVMDSTRPHVVTWWDKQHGRVLYKYRTAGSMSPDKDLPGNTINFPDPTKSLEFFGPDPHTDFDGVPLGQGLFQGPLIETVHH